jgi:hypothetical protein
MEHFLRDRRISVIRNQKGKLLERFDYICFGNLLSIQSRFTRIRNPATTLEHYFISNLNLRDTKLFLSRMTKLGLFKNVTATIATNKEEWSKIFPRSSYPNTVMESHPIVVMKTNVKECSPQEYMIVGFILRLLQNAPTIIKTWFYLLRNHKTADKFHLFLIAHTVYLPELEPIRPYGHHWLPSGFSKIRDVSLEKLFKHNTLVREFSQPIKNAPMIDKASSLIFSPSLTLQVASWLGGTWKPYSKALVTEFLKNVQPSNV